MTIEHNFSRIFILLACICVTLFQSCFFAPYPPYVRTADEYGSNLKIYESINSDTTYSEAYRLISAMRYRAFYFEPIPNDDYKVLKKFAFELTQGKFCFRVRDNPTGLPDIDNIIKVITYPPDTPAAKKMQGVENINIIGQELLAIRSLHLDD